MNSFRKTVGVLVLAGAVAVTGVSVFAPKAASALLPVEHDNRTAVIIEHDRKAVIVEHDNRTAVIMEHDNRTAVIVEHDNRTA